MGAHHRFYEHESDLSQIHMGARLYDPTLGRFLQVDPVEGGSCNDYEYACGDPINNFDSSSPDCANIVSTKCVATPLELFASTVAHWSPFASGTCSGGLMLCAKGGRQNKRLTGDQPEKEETPEQQKRRGTRRSSGGDRRGTKQPKPKRDSTLLPSCLPTLCELRQPWAW
ncbi:MAG: RHS repeat-associated core domain-containing protein [Acidimicrobiales bacterium]